MEFIITKKISEESNKSNNHAVIKYYLKDITYVKAKLITCLILFIKMK